MRDTIKSKEYFDEYILKMSEGIKRFEEGIAAGKYLNDKILFVKDYILQKKIGIIIAKYSKGDSIEEIKKEFESSLDLFGEAWDDSVYESNIIFASLAYLLNLDDGKLNIIKNKLRKSETYDSLLDFILIGNKSEFDTSKISFPRPYKKLVKSINDEDRDAFLKYLRGWYKGSVDSAWYGTHELVNKYQYYGYWCFEAGATVTDNSMIAHTCFKERLDLSELIRCELAHIVMGITVCTIVTIADFLRLIGTCELLTHIHDFVPDVADSKEVSVRNRQRTLAGRIDSARKLHTTGFHDLSHFQHKVTVSGKVLFRIFQSDQVTDTP